MTPKKNDLTPQKAMKWFDEIRKISIKRGGDAATKYEIQYMFKYADKLMQYQVPMPPVNVDEDGHYFECARCGQAFRSEMVAVYLAVMTVVQKNLWHGLTLNTSNQQFTGQKCQLTRQFW